MVPGARALIRPLEWLFSELSRLIVAILLFALLFFVSFWLFQIPNPSVGAALAPTLTLLLGLGPVTDSWISGVWRTFSWLVSVFSWLLIPILAGFIIEDLVLKLRDRARNRELIGRVLEAVPKEILPEKDRNRLGE